MAILSGRRPLIAGNWKMNLHHLEAIALVQKIAFDLRQKETDAVEVVVIPPFTDLRSVQTLVDGDRLPLGYGAQDLSPHVVRRLHRRHLRVRCWPSSAAPTSSSGTASAGSTTPRTTRWSRAKAKAAIAARPHADRLHRGDGAGPRRRRPRRALPGARWTARSTASRSPTPTGNPGWSSPTSRSGRSAPAAVPVPTTRRRCAAAHPASGSPTASGRRSPTVCGAVRRLGQGRRTPGTCSPAGRRRRARRRREHRGRRLHRHRAGRACPPDGRRRPHPIIVTNTQHCLRLSPVLPGR